MNYEELKYWAEYYEYITEKYPDLEEELISKGEI